MDDKSIKDVDMYFEKWDDIAFGSDSAMDFVDFIEGFDESITIEEIFSKSNFKKILVDLKNHDDFSTHLNGIDVTILSDQVLITLGAILVESEKNGSADLSKVLCGSKTVKLESSVEYKRLLRENLQNMIDNPKEHELMELCEDYIEEVQSVIQDIIDHLS